MTTLTFKRQGDASILTFRDRWIWLQEGDTAIGRLWGRWCYLREGDHEVLRLGRLWLCRVGRKVWLQWRKLDPAAV